MKGIYFGLLFIIYIVIIDKYIMGYLLDYFKEMARMTFYTIFFLREPILIVLLSLLGSIIFAFDKVIEIWKNRNKIRIHKAYVGFSILFLILSLTTVLKFMPPFNRIPIPIYHHSILLEALFSFTAGLLFIKSFCRKT